MTYLFLLRHSPYASTLAREALDMALATAAFGNDVTLVFLNDGVYQLLTAQDAQHKQRKNIAKTLDALALYDITHIYACADSLKQRGLDTRPLFSATQLASRDTLRTLIEHADNIISL